MLRGQIWTDSNQEMGSNFMSFLLLTWSFAAEGLSVQTSREDVRTLHWLPPGSEPILAMDCPWVHQPCAQRTAPCRLQLQAAPGTQYTEYTAYTSVRRPLFQISAADLLRGKAASSRVVMAWTGTVSLLQSPSLWETGIVPKWHRTLSSGKLGAIFPCPHSSTILSISSLAFSNV